MSADFDGNGFDDLLLYGPGTDPDRVWFFDEGLTHVARIRVVNGVYKPRATDVDGDTFGDVYWYGTGTTTDALWYGPPADAP